MRVDSMIRAIEAADSSSFRELALAYLTMLGYERVELRDGPNDGGNDVSLWQLGPNPEPIAVQLSVQKANWASKVRADAQRVADVWNYGHLLYVTSRRIPGVDANPVIDSLWAKQSVVLRIVDAQALASAFHLEGQSGMVLQALGILDRPSPVRGRRTTLREDAAYAYAFFGTDVESFRTAALDRSILAFVTAHPQSSRAVIEASVARTLKLTGARKKLIAARMDRMLQRGELTASEGIVEASAALGNEFKAARLVRDKEQRELEDEIGKYLGTVGLFGSALEQGTRAVADTAGALILSASILAGAAVEPGGDVGPARTRVRERLRTLERRLAALGLDTGRSARALIDLTSIIAQSAVGQTLLAGDLFLALLTMDQSDLLSALGGHTSLEVFLDASIAIPMLASLLYEPHGEHFFRAAHHVHQAAANHERIRLSLPRDYLEEAASHLIDASQSYAPLLENTPELRFSRNAFVAHFAGLRHEGKQTRDFASYAQSFGLPPAGSREQSFAVTRDWVMRRMTTLFSRYGIATVEPGTVPGQALKAAQEAIAYTARELQLSRAGRLLDHDIRAVADISSRVAAGDHAILFCTWDRLHLRLRTAGGAVEWNAIDPVMLGDLLALVSTDEDAMTFATVDVALGLSEAEVRRAAEIWDELVRIERDNFYDAELLERARAFKDSFLDAGRQASPRESLELAWNEWKSNGPSSR